MNDRSRVWIVGIVAAVAIAAVAIVALARPCCCCGGHVPNVHQCTLPPPLAPGGALELGALHEIIREATPDLVEPPAEQARVYDRPSLKIPRPEDYPRVPPYRVADVPEPASLALFLVALAGAAASRVPKA